MSIVQPEHRAKRRKVDTNGAKGLAFGHVGCPADVAAPVEACKDPSESRQVCRHGAVCCTITSLHVKDERAEPQSISGHPLICAVRFLLIFFLFFFWFG